MFERSARITVPATSFSEALGRLRRR